MAKATRVTKRHELRNKRTSANIRAKGWQRENRERAWGWTTAALVGFFELHPEARLMAPATSMKKARMNETKAHCMTHDILVLRAFPLSKNQQTDKTLS